MSTSLTNPLFVPPGTIFPLDGTENLIILQGNFITQARLNDVIHALVNGVSILAPQNVSTNSYSVSVGGVDKIFVNYNGAVSIVLPVLYYVPGQRTLIADRTSQCGPSTPITITTSAGVLFDGDTSIILNSPYGRVEVVYDGTNFVVVT